MRAVVQRVRRAAVTVEGSVTGEIAAGLLVFVGVASDDGPADVEYIVNKTRELRIFPDEHGRMNRSVVESGGAVLVVSQFTLQADCRKGRRPSFDGAAPGPLARALYDDVVRRLRDGRPGGRHRRVPGGHGRRARQRRPGHAAARQPENF